MKKCTITRWKISQSQPWDENDIIKCWQYVHFFVAGHRPLVSYHHICAKKSLSIYEQDWIATIYGVLNSTTAFSLPYSLRAKIGDYRSTPISSGTVSYWKGPPCPGPIPHMVKIMESRHSYKWQDSTVPSKSSSGIDPTGSMVGKFFCVYPSP